MAQERFPYGGQAVFEGVMMRGRRQATTAVRTADGAIVFHHERFDVGRRAVWERLPLLRGVLLLWDTLNLGMRSMTFSINVAGGEQHAPLSKKEITGAVALSLVIVVCLFFLAPFLVANLFGWLGAPPLLRDIIDGLLGLAIFVGYLVLMGRQPEAQRLFGYHGAEHKVVNAYEAGAPLTVESVRSFSLIHPRCGTSFVLVVVVLGIVISALLGWLPFWARLASRIVMVPLVAALAYELLRLSASNYHRLWVQRLVAPSLAFQQLTTREPDDAMIEVAITALVPVLAADGVEVEHSSPALVVAAHMPS